MKKYFLLLTVLVMSTVSNALYAKWVYRNISNEFGENYKVAYTSGSDIYLEILQSDGFPNYPNLYICGKYFCDKIGVIDISFMVNGKWKLHKDIIAYRGDKMDTYMIPYANCFLKEDFKNDFLNASQVSIRIKQDYCQNTYAKIDMSFSSNALNFFINDELKQQEKIAIESIKKELKEKQEKKHREDSIKVAMQIKEIILPNIIINGHNDTIIVNKIVDSYENPLVDININHYFIQYNIIDDIAFGYYREVYSGKICEKCIYTFDKERKFMKLKM